MKKKACKKCRLIVEGEHCPVCNGTDFSVNIKGRAYIIDVKNSQIAKKMGCTIKGEHAVKL